MKTKKFNLVGLGARDYYHVAVALKQVDQLGHIITDFYSPNLLRVKFHTRFHPEIDSSQTISLPVFYVLQVIARRIFSPEVFRRVQHQWIDKFFGFLSGAITYFGANRAIVYSYYLEGFTLFYKTIRKRPLELICFQVHPTSVYICDKLAKDRNIFQNLYGNVAFLDEPEQATDDAQVDSYRVALSYCDQFICASSASARSVAMVHPSLPGTVIPYGSKLQDRVYLKCRGSRAKEKIRLITVCQLVQRKGLHWAFYAMRSLTDEIRDRFEWIVVSNVVDNSIKALAPDNVEFRSRLSDDQIALTLADADIFVMPSLIEGFGLVYIESLSVGTPIIYTNETGAGDICVSGIHGFEVGCSDVNQLIDVFNRLANNPTQLHKMREDAVELSKRINWPNFHRLIQNTMSVK